MKDNLFKHIKTGNVYEVLGTATLQADTPLSDMAIVVLYRAESGTKWVRPVSEFTEKFEQVFVQESLNERIATQNSEFNAMGLLANRWSALQMTPVVDDDYPQVRDRYEAAVRHFLAACKNNGRTM